MSSIRTTLYGLAKLASLLLEEPPNPKVRLRQRLIPTTQRLGDQTLKGQFHA
jgi:hypothetical protein